MQLIFEWVYRSQLAVCYCFFRIQEVDDSSLIRYVLLKELLDNEKRLKVNLQEHEPKILLETTFNMSNGYYISCYYNGLVSSQLLCLF
jgi:hypothetical protein